MRHLLNLAVAAAAIGLFVQIVGAPRARADTPPDPAGRTAGRAPLLGTTPRPTSARGAAISAAEFPPDPKNFGRHHAPPVRPIRRGAAHPMAHTILSRPLQATRGTRSHGRRGGAPVVWPGALDPRKAPKYVGAIVWS